MGYVFRDETQQMAVDNLRRFLGDKVEPLYNGVYRDRFVPKEVLKGLLRQLVDFGLIAGVVPEAKGGLGIDWLTGMMLFEEVCAISLDFSIPVAINTFGADYLATIASPQIQERYLPGLLSGESFISIAISEPDVGSNPAAVRTRARRDGDHWILNGEKTWISNGEYSDFLICTCRTGDKPGEISQFLLDRKEHPYEVRNIHKVSLHGQSTAQIFLSDVRVPHENMIGPEGRALRNALALFERSRVYVAMQGVGLARRALEEAVRYAGERKQFGKAIAEHQLIAAILADMATKMDAARLLTMRAAAMVEKGVPAEMEAAMAKLYAAEAAVEIARQAVQIHGANGVTTEFLVEKLARDSLIVPIYEGTSQIQQLIIARALTGKAAF